MNFCKRLGCFFVDVRIRYFQSVFATFHFLEEMQFFGTVNESRGTLISKATMNVKVLVDCFDHKTQTTYVGDNQFLKV